MVRRRARRIGHAGLLVLFASAFLAPGAANAGLALVATAFPFAFDHWRTLLRQPVVLAILACAIYLAVLTVALSLRPPGGTGIHWSGLSAWLQLSLFVPVAFFVRAANADLGRLLLLCVLGLVIGILWRLDWEQLLRSPQAYLYTSRDSFGFTAIGFALISGTALLGMVLLRRRWWAGSLPRVLLWIFCLLSLLQGFLITQARGSWLALVAAAGFAFFLSHRYRDVSTDGIRARALRWTAIVLALGVLAATQGQMIASRLLAEIPVVEDIVSGKEEYDTKSSFALRWNAQIFGVKTWLRRPMTGWGPETSRDLMAASGDSNLESEPGSVLTHLHNTYLELLVQTGLLGLVLAGLLIGLLLRGLVRAFRAGRLATDLYVFFLSAFVLLLLWCLFDYRAVHQDWRFYWILLAGTVFSFSLHDEIAAGNQ